MITAHGLPLDRTPGTINRSATGTSQVCFASRWAADPALLAAAHCSHEVKLRRPFHDDPTDRPDFVATRSLGRCGSFVTDVLLGRK